jgi:hypothetical protein
MDEPFLFSRSSSTCLGRGLFHASYQMATHCHSHEESTTGSGNRSEVREGWVFAPSVSASG